MAGISKKEFRQLIELMEQLTSALMILARSIRDPDNFAIKQINEIHTELAKLTKRYS